MQEQTEQQKQMAKIKEYELSMEQMKVEGKRVDGEQKRKYLEEESKQQKHKAEYQVRHICQNISTIVLVSAGLWNWGRGIFFLNIQYPKLLNLCVTRIATELH